MADADGNIVSGPGRGAAARAGDLPPAVRRRYLSQRDPGPSLGFYVDATIRRPAFRDTGRRLTTQRNDPAIVRDLIAIARHRGWTTVQVRGDPDFRREAWTAARAGGLEVRGYRPTERDHQVLARRLAARSQSPPPSAPDLDADLRRRIVEAVARDRIVEPAARDRVLAAAMRRLFRKPERAPDARER